MPQVLPSETRLRCSRKLETTKAGPAGSHGAGLSELRSAALGKTSRKVRYGGCCEAVCGGVKNAQIRIVSAIDRAVRRTRYYDKKESSDPYYAFDRECARFGEPKMPPFQEVVRRPEILNNIMATRFGQIAKVDLARAVGVDRLSRNQIETLSRQIDSLASPPASSETAVGWISRCGEKFAREHLTVRIVNELQ